jgi:hypothetical protein
MIALPGETPPHVDETCGGDKSIINLILRSRAEHGVSKDGCIAREDGCKRP